MTADKPVSKLIVLAPWFCFLWFAGVACMSLRLASGWFALVLARRTRTKPAPDWLVELIDDLRQRLAVRQVVRCWQSSRVAIPAVVGWLSPAILLPASALTGLSPDQLRMVLAHELAHIRRHDFLVNVFQSVVETLLFYHPAVWLLSQRIRAEREFCCDDLAMTVDPDRVAYAKALSALESTRNSVSQFAISSQGGPLMIRIRRILGLPVGNRMSFRPGVSFVASTLLLLLTAAGFALAKSPANMPQDPIPAESQSRKSIADQKIDLRTEIEKRRSDREAMESKLTQLDEQKKKLTAQSVEKTAARIREATREVRDAVALDRAKNAIDELLQTTDDPIQQKQYQDWLQTLGNKRSLQGAVQQAIDKGHFNGGALTDVVPTQIATITSRPSKNFQFRMDDAQELIKSGALQTIRPNIVCEWPKNTATPWVNVQVTADTQADLDLVGTVVEFLWKKGKFRLSTALNLESTGPIVSKNESGIAARVDSEVNELSKADMINEASGLVEEPINQDPLKPLPAVDSSNVPKAMVAVVFKLQHCAATDTAVAINSLGREFWDADPPKIVADARANSIVIVGTQKQREQLEGLMKLLDRSSEKDLPAETELPQAKKSDVEKKMQVHFFQLELERANLNLSHTSKELDQVRELRAAGTTTSQELGRAEHAYALAQLEQRFAQLKLDAAEQGVDLPRK
jgi:beta-lactamase regulating signal transducer with metallopeptidase domain